MVHTLEELVTKSNPLVLRQKKELTEIVLNWETRNKYEVLTPENQNLAFVVERGGGMWDFFRRGFFRSHRAFEVDVFGAGGKTLMRFYRSFFFFFSDLYIAGGNREKIGSVHRRFGILYKKYDLLDESGRLFAKISCPIWNLWTFPIFNLRGRQIGKITKKWQGVLKEVFTDADTFFVDYAQGEWTPNQRAVVLASAMSIDFDFFEDNQNR